MATVRMLRTIWTMRISEVPGQRGPRAAMVGFKARQSLLAGLSRTLSGGEDARARAPAPGRAPLASVPEHQDGGGDAKTGGPSTGSIKVCLYM